MKRFVLTIALWILFAGCGSVPAMQDPPPVPEPYAALDETKPIALVNALLIDGTGAQAVKGGTVVFRNGIIVAAGSGISLPAGCQVIDMAGAAVLPGLVNAHVHNAFYPRHAKIFAYSGVTTVRDLHVEAGRLRDACLFRDEANADPSMCRILSAGSIVTVPFGYHSADGFTVRSPADAAAVVDREADAGVDLVKIAFQEPHFPDLANLTPELGKAIVERAHQRGLRVTAHVGSARDLEAALESGADDIAHIPYDEFSDALIRRMVEGKIPLEPTLTDWATSTGKEREIILSNFRRFMDAGGIIALGAEHVHTAKNAGAFIGIPLAEFEMMREGGMDPMRIIVASTRTAAAVCGLEETLGTLEPGKNADILVLDGDPLADIGAFGKVKAVVLRGKFIRG